MIAPARSGRIDIYRRERILASLVATEEHVHRTFHGATEAVWIDSVKHA